MYSAYITLLRTPHMKAAQERSVERRIERERERDPKIGALAQVMPLNCNSFRFAHAASPFISPLLLSHSLCYTPSLSCSLPLCSSLSQTCAVLNVPVCFMQSSSLMPFNLRRVLDTNAA